MTIITLTDCPPKLRGYLSKWLQEINTGVYVGRVSARVRGELWERVIENAGSGRATMVFNTNNEQGMDFRVHNTTWEPIDFDGLKLMLRPSPARLAGRQKRLQNQTYSKARSFHMARVMSRSRKGKTDIEQLKQEGYVVVDIETTGLSPDAHEIIEIAAVRVVDGVISDTFQTLIKPDNPVPVEIEKLTGLSTASLADGKKILEVLPEFISFVGKYDVVCHNAAFDMGFINAACTKCGFPTLKNNQICTLKIARQKITKIRNYKLATLLDYFGINYEQAHRGLDDCKSTQQLYAKLNEIG